MHITFAGYEMDLRSHELRRGGAVVHVEPQVFDLLLHLVRNRDRVVGKDELFEVVWNGRIVSEAALSSRINAARRAIGDDGDRQALIRTVHKRGFRFMGEAQELADEADKLPEPAAVPPLSPQPGASERKPSIVVMPLTNLSPEPDSEYFSYGLTEDIIRLLARNHWLDVLSRHSGAAYRGRDVPAQEIGATLGVRYIVQGSVAKRGERLRIGADLVSAETGRELWSETYDLGLADLLQVQEAMAQQIAATIEPELSRLEQEAAMRKPPASMDVWDCYQRGLYHMWGFSTPGFVEAEAMFRRAVALDPGFARAHGALAYVLLQAAMQRRPEERPAMLDTALRHAHRAVQLDGRDCMNQCVLGRVHVLRGEHDDGIAALERSIAMNPSFAQGYFALAHALIWSGRVPEALPLLDRAAKLSPHDPHMSIFFDLRAKACLSLGEVEEATVFARKAVRQPNATYHALTTLVAALGLLGREEELQGWRRELLRRVPDYSCSYARHDFAFSRNEAALESFITGLRQAGIPEQAGPVQAPRAAEPAPAR
jgi:TolB-like protein/thioredoxin-like negative regulator of GroEL